MAFIKPTGLFTPRVKKNNNNKLQIIIITTQLNDTIWRALSCAGIPSVKKPVGLSRSDGKHPDGMTLVPWSTGKCAEWDVTVIDTLANSYLNSTSITAGAAAEIAASRKLEKYQDLARGYEVVSMTLETMGPIIPMMLSL